LKAIFFVSRYYFRLTSYETWIAKILARDRSLRAHLISLPLARGWYLISFVHSVQA